LEKLEPKRIANTYLATQINYCIKEKNSKRFIRWDGNQYVDNNEVTIYLLYLETCSYCPTSDWYSFQIEDLNGNDLKMKNKQTNQYISFIIIIGIFVLSNCSYPYNDSLLARRPIKYLTIESTNDKLVAISCALDRDIYLTANNIGFSSGNHFIYRLEGYPSYDVVNGFSFLPIISYQHWFHRLSMKYRSKIY